MAKNALYLGDAVVKRGLAKVGKSNGVGMCQKEIRQLFGVPSVGDFDKDGDADAHDAWKAAVKNGEVVRDRKIKNAPPGAYLYFSGGKHGHVALGLGGDLCVSTDAHKNGVWGKVAPSKLAKRWGMRYEGYIVVTGNGYRVFDLPVATKSTRYEVKVKKVNAYQWPSAYSAVKASREKGFRFTSKKRSGDWVQATSLWYRKSQLKVVPDTKPPAGKPDAGRAWFRLMSWNIAGANAKGIKNWKSRRNAVLARMESSEPHVICLQEGYNKLSTGEPMLDWMLEHTQYRLVAVRSGRAILRHPSVVFVAKGSFAPTTIAKGNPRKYATWALLRVDGVLTLHVNAHTQHGAAYDKVRTSWARELALMVEKLRKSEKVAKVNTFISGDWNGREGATVFAKYGYVDAASNAHKTANMMYKTLNSWKKGFKKGARIDYILAGAKRPVLAVTQKEDYTLSDHNAQTVLLARKPR